MLAGEPCPLPIALACAHAVEQASGIAPRPMCGGRRRGRAGLGSGAAIGAGALRGPSTWCWAWARPWTMAWA